MKMRNARFFEAVFGLPLYFGKFILYLIKNRPSSTELVPVWKSLLIVIFQ